MSRSAFGIAALCAVAFSWQPAGAAEDARQPTPVRVVLKELKQVRDQFSEVPADPQTKLGNILNALSVKYSRPGDNPPVYLTFLINEKAFAEEGIADVNEVQVVGDRPLRKMDQVSLDTYLGKIFERVPVLSGATYIVRKEYIEITTVSAVRREVWGEKHPGPFLPLIHANFEKTTLSDALRELAGQTRYTVVLDPSAEEKTKAALTAHFVNTPLDTAVTLLADMSGLKAVRRDNTLYVTTAENAGRLQPAEPPADKEKQGKVRPARKANTGSGPTR